MATPEESDRTVVVPRGGRRPARRWPLAGAAILLLGLGGGIGWWLGRGPPPPAADALRSILRPPSPIVAAPIVGAPIVGAPVAAIAPAPFVPTSPPAPIVPAIGTAPDLTPGALPPASGFSIRTADEASILANDPARLTIFRFAPNPAVLVLDFPTLAQQARMLNRIAVFIEKAGAPHDRVLDDAALAETIRRGGDLPDTYYYGHDYRSSDIARFFRSAESENVALNADELWLSSFARLNGWLDAASDHREGALISIPRVGSDGFMNAKARAVILHHELSHGEYFTNPAYAAYVRQFWTSVLSDSDRALFRAFLAGEKYDAGIEDLMINETQAYLMHTHDARFFSAAILKMPQRRIDELQGLFLLDMPPGWLRDCTTAPPLAAAPAIFSARPQERRQSP